MAIASLNFAYLPVLLKATALIMDEIIIVEYDPRWPTLFEEEAARVWNVLGNEMVVKIEHIGSTAVPGLAAKPVIDLMAGNCVFLSASCAKGDATHIAPHRWDQ